MLLSEIIAVIMSACALAISLISLCCSLIPNRKQVKVAISAVCKNSDVTYIKLILSNNSRLAIAISNFSIHQNGSVFSFGETSEVIFYEPFTQAVKSRSVELPLILSPLYAIGCILAMKSPFNVQGDALVKLETSRGPITLKAIIPAISEIHKSL